MLSRDLLKLVSDYLDLADYFSLLQCNSYCWNLLSSFSCLHQLFLKKNLGNDPLLTREDYLSALEAYSWTAYNLQGEEIVLPEVALSFELYHKETWYICYLDIYGRFYCDDQLLARNIKEVGSLSEGKLVLLDREGNLIVDDKKYSLGAQTMRVGRSRIAYQQTDGSWRVFYLNDGTNSALVCQRFRTNRLTDVAFIKREEEHMYLFVKNYLFLEQDYEFSNIKKIASFGNSLIISKHNPGETISWTFPNMRYGDRVLLTQVVDFWTRPGLLCALTCEGKVYHNKGYNNYFMLDLDFLFQVEPERYRSIKMLHREKIFLLR